MATWISVAERQVIAVARLIVQDGMSPIMAMEAVGVQWSGSQFSGLVTKLANNPAVGQATRAVLVQAAEVTAGAGEVAAGAGAVAGTAEVAAGSAATETAGGIVLSTALTWLVYATVVLGSSYLLASKIGSVQCHVVVTNGVRSSCSCINDSWIPEFYVESLKEQACGSLR